MEPTKIKYVDQYSYDPSYGYDLLFASIKLVIDDNLPKIWQFPKHRFVEYEPKDEWWCRKYGFGKEIDGPVCYKYYTRGKGYSFVCNSNFLETVLDPIKNAGKIRSEKMIFPTSSTVECEITLTKEGRVWVDSLIEEMTCKK